MILATSEDFPLIKHRGIVVVEDDGQVNVFHNVPSIKNIRGGSIVKESLEEWTKNRLIKSVEPTNLTREQIIEASIIDQVSHWPSVLDQARQVRESTRQIATTGARWARASTSNNPNTHGGITQVIQAVEVTEELLLITAVDKDTAENSTAAPR
jgi:hypothetical protein